MTSPAQYDWMKLNENINRLMDLASQQQIEIVRLRKELQDKESCLKEAEGKRAIAEASSTALLTVRAIAGGDDELRETKQRLDRLMKDVDRCIALLEVE